MFLSFLMSKTRVRLQNQHKSFFKLFFKKLALKQLLFLKNIFKLEPTQRSFRKSINRRERWIIYFNSITKGWICKVTFKIEL